MDLVDIAKSQIAPGVFRPITRLVGGRHVADPTVKSIVGAKVRGDPVFHGGTKGRILSLKRGRDVDTTSGVGQGQVGGEGRGHVFTTTHLPSAQLYGAAGRTPENFRRFGHMEMNANVVPRSRGHVGEFNMKGQWPLAAREIGGGQAELTYSPSQLQRGFTRMHGIKPGRTRQHQQTVAMRNRFESSLGGGGLGAFGGLV